MGFLKKYGSPVLGGLTGGLGGAAVGYGADLLSGGKASNKIGGAAEDAWGAYKEGMNRDKAGALGKLGDESTRASQFANASERDFGRLGVEGTQERDYLRKIARGEESVSAVQLQNALQQNQGAQQSMAAGARPGNAAMAARQAAMNAARQGAGLAGQQATAGIQERQAGQNALAQMLMQQRQQELQAALQSRNQAIGGFGTQFTGQMGQPTGMEQGLSLLTSGAKLAGGLG